MYGTDSAAVPSATLPHLSSPPSDERQERKEEEVRKGVFSFFLYAKTGFTPLRVPFVNGLYPTISLCSNGLLVVCHLRTYLEANIVLPNKSLVEHF